MFLKRIEMLGFKSFAEKTAIELELGVTAIVGPNGCGKSNIADALRWVFGEQNPRLLRGTQMEDVIFNGTDHRRAIGRAEVSVTFTHAEGALPLDYHEVTITRRLFRSGESQYLINQTPCLLRNVRELFMGTGIGTSAYFLLEQGKIDLILSAKPEDRRAVFEEAAGIQKYKVKKKASLQRLESTEANLIRLADIIREVKRQIISLERQAGKAKRYQEAREELKKLELKVARNDYENRAKELRGLEDRIRQQTSLRDSVQEQIALLQKKIEDIEKSHQSIFDELSHLEKSDLELHHKIQSALAELGMVKERILEFESRMKSDQEEMAQAQGRLADLVHQSKLEQEGRDKFLKLNENQKCDLEKRRNDLEAVLKLCKKDQEVLSLAKSRFIDLKQQEAQLKNQMMVYHHRQKDSVLRKEKLVTEREKVRLHADGKRREKDQAESLKNRLSQEIIQIQETLRADLDQKGKVGVEKLRVLKELESEKEKLIKYTTRFEMAREWGVVNSFGPFHGNGSDKVFESILDIPGKFRKALRSVLGKKLGSVLKEKRNLIQRNGGGVYFPLDTEIALNDPLDFGKVPGFVGYACDLVRFPKEYQGAVRALLGDLVVLEDFGSLSEIESSWLGHFRFVTLDGDFVDYDGTWSCNGASPDVIDLAVLEQEIQSSSRKISDFHAQKEPLERQWDELEKKSALEQERLRLKELECSNVSGQFERLVAKLRDLEEEDWSLAREEEDLVASIEESEKMVIHITGDLTGISRPCKDLAFEIEQREKGIVALVNDKESALVELAEIKVLSRSLEDEERRFSARIHEIQANVRELEQFMGKRREELSALVKRKEENLAKTQSLQEDLERWSKEKEALKVRKEEVSKSVRDIEKEVHQDREELSFQTAELDPLREELSGLEVKKAQGVLQQENLLQRIKEKYDLDLLKWPLEERILDESILQRILELQEKLRQMGEVNLVAIQEFDDYRSRYEFLLKQQEDLVHAKEDLIKAIQKINMTIREMFLETFERIRGTFNDLFRRLFGGGRAVLQLLDEGDVLECGIDIAAQPPGKKLQAISLLSGGERTLTALALLLAIFKVRPSPFCFMDEMDAALDESNILRFLSMIEEFKSQTQFILITHNKRTISVADVVYGVTMEESGISRIISIRLPEAKEKVLAAG